MKEPEGLETLVGVDVYIEWQDKMQTWHWYRVVLVDRITGWIRLMGLPSDEGDPFTGSQFWTSLSDIDTIELVE